MTGRSAPCLVCGAHVQPLFRVDEVPVLTTAFSPTSAEATRVPRATLDLAGCQACGHVQNAAFEPGLVEYSASYENSQHFSPTFRRFAEQLAERLADEHPLAGGRVVEVGCGEGEFLALLCDVADCTGLGFDPSYAGESVGGTGRVAVTATVFAPGTVDVDVDLVCCRHVLEHLPDPIGFLDGIRRTIPRGTPVYFEVPNGDFVLGPNGLWDLVYQHVSYFSATSLELLFERAGFRSVQVVESFGGQFLSIDAIADVPSKEVRALEMTADPRLDRRAISELYRRTVGEWRAALSARSGTTLLWGAGSKGVTFLNVMGVAHGPSAVVDVNPRKWGRFVPGTAHEVLDPTQLDGADIGLVVVSNGLYEAEIRTELGQLGIEAEVRCL